jgi:hypothetical protein
MEFDFIYVSILAKKGDMCWICCLFGRALEAGKVDWHQLFPVRVCSIFCADRGALCSLAKLNEAAFNSKDVAVDGDHDRALTLLLQKTISVRL